MFFVKLLLLIVRDDVRGSHSVGRLALEEHCARGAILRQVHILLDELVPVAIKEGIEESDIVLDDPVVVDTGHQESPSSLLIVEDFETLCHEEVGLVLDVFHALL